MNDVFERIMELRSDALDANLPCTTLRLGGRQYTELRAFVYENWRNHDWQPSAVTPLESVCGMKIERVESPDYMEIS